MQDSSAYLDKKRTFNNVLTLYGRKPVLEALEDDELSVFRLHLADSNKPDKLTNRILELAEARDTEVRYHNRESLSRISKNRKQDQGVALDVKLKKFSEVSALTELPPGNFIALDRVTNPQNLGMIIRSVAASGCAGLLLPREGCASLGPLVIKASTGTLFKAPIFRCDKLTEGLDHLEKLGAVSTSLDLKATKTLSQLDKSIQRVFILGNETEGVSKQISACAKEQVKIEMHNGVESLNVAVTAALLCFLTN